MEQEPKPSRVQEVDQQKNIESEELRALEAQEDIDHLTTSLRFFLESLERQKDLLQKPKELLNTEHRDEIREKIEKTKKIIKEIHGRIHELIIDKIDSAENIEKFKEFERDYNEAFLEILSEGPVGEEEGDDFEKKDNLDIIDFSKDRLN